MCLGGWLEGGDGAGGEFFVEFGDAGFDAADTFAEAFNYVCLSVCLFVCLSIRPSPFVVSHQPLSVSEAFNYEGLTV